jgi:hypothetical protein
VKSEIVKQVLIDHGIDAVLIDKKGYPYNFGQVEVYVGNNNFSHATELIVANDL